MRRLSFVFVLLSALFYACESNVDEPGFDCSDSDLSVAVVGSVKSDCLVPGQIAVQASGGDGFYQYSIDGESFQSDTIFTNIFAGLFDIQVRDGAGCTSNVTFRLESEATGITLDLQSTISECGSPTGSITAIASGGIGTLQFSLDNGTFSTTSFFGSVGPGDYNITVRDEEGCQVSKSVSIITNVSLSSDIMPIVSRDCAISGCHNGSVSPRLTTSSAIVQNARRIKSETQSRSMPRNRSLTQDEIDLIACWVDSGALDN